MACGCLLTINGRNHINDTNNNQQTVFVAGGTGYMGEHVLKTLASERPDLKVYAVTRSQKSAGIVSALGAEPVDGDIMQPGEWQNKAKEAEYIIHAAQPFVSFSARGTRKVGEKYGRERLIMDTNLLDPLDPQQTKRVVYCSGNSYYGATGLTPQDETMQLNPIGFGEYIKPAVDQNEAYIAKGLDLVTVFPAAAYGDGAWLKEYFIKPIRAGKKVIKVGEGGKYMSPIYVKDIARAMIFMLDVPGKKLDEVGRQILLVDDKPVTYEEVAAEVGKLLGKQVKTARIPGFLFKLMAGEINASYMMSHTIYSNARLKKLGFELKYPSIYQGFPEFIKL